MTDPGELWPYAVLAAAGLLAGVINTVAGGGSLLTLPALMLTGLPVHVANGSNRLSVITHSVAGVVAFQRAGRLPGPAVLPVALPTMLGAGVGAGAAAAAPAWLLEPVLLGTLVVMALLLVARPSMVPDDDAEEEPRAVFGHPPAMAGLFLAGVYGGFVQAGVGFVLLGVLGGVLRYEMLRANALKLVCTLLFGIVALAVFAGAGQVAWVPAAVLAVSTALGAQLGVRLALRIPPVALRWFLVVTVVVSVAAILLR